MVKDRKIRKIYESPQRIAKLINGDRISYDLCIDVGGSKATKRLRDCELVYIGTGNIYAIGGVLHYSKVLKDFYAICWPEETNKNEYN